MKAPKIIILAVIITNSFITIAQDALARARIAAITRERNEESIGMLGLKTGCAGFISGYSQKPLFVVAAATLSAFETSRLKTLDEDKQADWKTLRKFSAVTGFGLGIVLGITANKFVRIISGVDDAEQKS